MSQSEIVRIVTLRSWHAKLIDSLPRRWRWPWDACGCCSICPWEGLCRDRDCRGSSWCRHVISVLVADSKVRNEENLHISDLDVYFELNIIKYRSIKVHDSWHAFMANTPNIWYPSPDRLSVHLALLQALFWVAAKRIRCRNHDELLHLRWVKHQSGCQPTRRRCSMVQKARAKRRHVNEIIQPYAEYFWILLICFFRARHEHIQLSDAMSVNLGARTGSLLASGITLCSSARFFGPVEPNIWKTWCACEGASLVATLVVVSQGSSVAYRL